MAPIVTTHYYRIVGAMQLPGGRIRHFLDEVADATGAPYAGMNPNDVGTDRTYDTPPAQEQPRGTIVKIVDTLNRVITLNPAS